MEELGILVVLYLAIIVLMIVSLWKVFTKAGKPGWACLIPIYNIIVMIEITGKPLWWFFMFLIPGVNLVFAIWMLNLISKSFGNGVGFTIGLLLLPIIFWPILGLGSSEYQGPAAEEAQATQASA